MIGYAEIIHILFKENDPQKAIEQTIERDPDNAYSFYKYCRQRIFKDDENRDPHYLQRVRHFQHAHYSPQDPEWGFLDGLMEQPLRAQYRVETARRRYLSNPQLDQALKAINCLPPCFYEYKMPTDVVEDAVDKLRERRELKHARPVHISNLQTIVSTAREWRCFKHPWELVACASILSGRRTQEIVRDMEYEPYSEYCLSVRKLCKQEIGSGVIPLLCLADEFCELMGKIREHQLPIDSSTHRLKPAFLRLFGQWYNHSERRNMYCEAAWRMREVSGFYPETSKIMWFDKALCHDVNVVAQNANLAYQSLQFADV
jgi:hypothetical protein